MWTEIAKFMDGKTLVMLAATCRWFYGLLMDESVWKHACLRDLQVPDPRQEGLKWIKLYAKAFGEHQLLRFLSLNSFITAASNFCTTNIIVLLFDGIHGINSFQMEVILTRIASRTSI